MPRQKARGSGSVTWRTSHDCCDEANGEQARCNPLMTADGKDHGNRDDKEDRGIHALSA
jgi:hypothetical protein